MKLRIGLLIFWIWKFSIVGGLALAPMSMHLKAVSEISAPALHALNSLLEKRDLALRDFFPEDSDSEGKDELAYLVLGFVQHYWNSLSNDTLKASLFDHILTSDFNTGLPRGTMSEIDDFWIYIRTHIDSQHWLKLRKLMTVYMTMEIAEVLDREQKILEASNAYDANIFLNNHFDHQKYFLIYYTKFSEQERPYALGRYYVRLAEYQQSKGNHSAAIENLHKAHSLLKTQPKSSKLDSEYEVWRLRCSIQLYKACSKNEKPEDACNSLKKVKISKKADSRTAIWQGIYFYYRAQSVISNPNFYKSLYKKVFDKNATYEQYLGKAWHKLSMIAGQEAPWKVVFVMQWRIRVACALTRYLCKSNMNYQTLERKLIRHKDILNELLGDLGKHDSVFLNEPLLKLQLQYGLASLNYRLGLSQDAQVHLENSLGLISSMYLYYSFESVRYTVRDIVLTWIEVIRQSVMLREFFEMNHSGQNKNFIRKRDQLSEMTVSVGEALSDSLGSWGQEQYLMDIAHYWRAYWFLTYSQIEQVNHTQFIENDNFKRAFSHYSAIKDSYLKERLLPYLTRLQAKGNPSNMSLVKKVEKLMLQTPTASPAILDRVPPKELFKMPQEASFHVPLAFHAVSPAKDPQPEGSPFEGPLYLPDHLSSKEGPQTCRGDQAAMPMPIILLKQIASSA